MTPQDVFTMSAAGLPQGATFTRNAAIVAEVTGEALAANAPNYTRKTTIIASNSDAPLVEADVIDLFAAGYDGLGRTPVLVYRKINGGSAGVDQAAIKIRVGETVYTFRPELRDANAVVDHRGITDATHAVEVKCASVTDGLIRLTCAVVANRNTDADGDWDEDDWEVQGICVVWGNAESLVDDDFAASFPNGWSQIAAVALGSGTIPVEHSLIALAGASAPATTAVASTAIGPTNNSPTGDSPEPRANGANRVQTWSDQTSWHPLGTYGAAPLSCWAAITDYRTNANSPDGGIGFIRKFTRSAVGSPWSAAGDRPVVLQRSGHFPSQHFHTMVIVKPLSPEATTSIAVVTSFGDGRDSNTNDVFLFRDIPPQIDDATTWQIYQEAYGQFDPETKAGNDLAVVDGVTEDDSANANQFIGAACWPLDQTYAVIGQDVTFDNIAALQVDADPTPDDPPVLLFTNLAAVAGNTQLGTTPGFRSTLELFQGSGGKIHTRGEQNPMAFWVTHAQGAAWVPGVYETEGDDDIITQRRRRLAVNVGESLDRWAYVDLPLASFASSPSNIRILGGTVYINVAGNLYQTTLRFAENCDLLRVSCGSPGNWMLNSTESSSGGERVLQFTGGSDATRLAAETAGLLAASNGGWTHPATLYDGVTAHPKAGTAIVAPPVDTADGNPLFRVEFLHDDGFVQSEGIINPTGIGAADNRPPLTIGSPCVMRAFVLSDQTAIGIPGRADVSFRNNSTNDITFSSLSSSAGSETEWMPVLMHGDPQITQAARPIFKFRPFGDARTGNTAHYVAFDSFTIGYPGYPGATKRTTATDTTPPTMPDEQLTLSYFKPLPSSGWTVMSTLAVPESEWDHATTFGEEVAVCCVRQDAGNYILVTYEVTGYTDAVLNATYNRAETKARARIYEAGVLAETIEIDNPVAYRGQTFTVMVRQSEDGTITFDWMTGQQPNNRTDSAATYRFAPVDQVFHDPAGTLPHGVQVASVRSYATPLRDDRIDDAAWVLAQPEGLRLSRTRGRLIPISNR